MKNKEKKSQVYDVKVLDSRSRAMKNVQVNARDMSEASLQALNYGSVINVKKKFSFGVGAKLSSADRFIFLNRLSTMISSKVGTGDALKLMRDTFGGRIKHVSDSMYKKIEQGKDIGEAMESIGPAAFPSGIVALVKAGSQGGDTGKALLDAATFEQELNDIKKESSKGMTSAIAGFLFAGVFLAGSSFYLSPKVKNSPLFKEVPVDTSLVDMIASVMGWVMLVVMIIFILLLLLGSVFKRIMPDLSDSIILRIPFYRDLVLAKNSYATLYGLAMLVASGVRIEDSLRITMENSPKGALRTDLKRSWEAIRKGLSWPNQMSTLHPTDRAALMTSSNREQVARTLSNLSTQYRRMYGERLKIIIPTMQLISALLLSLAGTIMFGQIILPMLKLTQSIA